jgi:hypothetical protein
MRTVSKKVMVSPCYTEVANARKKLKARLTQISQKETDLPSDNQQDYSLVHSTPNY